MNAIASLRASAEACDIAGKHKVAKQLRLWATQAEADGPKLGNALYYHYAVQAAEYATGELRKFHQSQEGAGDAQQAPRRVMR